MCSLFAIRSNDKMLIGKNKDHVQNGGSIHFVNNEYRYGLQTIPHFTLEQLGIDRPYDGVNQHGLYAGVTAIPEKKVGDSAQRHPVISSFGLIKYVLERAVDAKQALAIAEKFRIDYLKNYDYPRVQFFFADKHYNVIIYEEDTAVNSFCLKNGEYQYITNNPYYDKTSRNECPRVTVLEEVLKANPAKSLEDVLSLLSKVNLAKFEPLPGVCSIYSVGCDLTNMEINLVIEEDYSNPFPYNITKELKNPRHEHFSLLRSQKFRFFSNHFGSWDNESVQTTA
ncbi:hypothetical protein QA601_17105 [Chitinispirillales bacterium ANBcel5]|uniref:hypothetical protein n=1 Tax=Cellulosispirillum alkaliphilum TaxID=3039283 RepID=UPI002A4E4629|nr:hypothetical protein [Chitinispirillales bacterium ANBcel5]